ncbi:c-factor [Trichonephila inaurata madagascariensis]|uniref:C-factor n=1 Tax=Trichonephila inaurata madagascariensis TaxID=2747483 RepID=A0A8X6XEM2_9ARAC|nr:c-factor [Trichonephila inaurata madagascariensis]
MMALRFPKHLLRFFHEFVTPEFCLRQKRFQSGVGQPPKEQTLELDTVMVTGATRGIGLEFVRQLVGLPKPPRIVFATYRNENTLMGLNEIKIRSESTKLEFLRLDVTIQSEITQAAEKVVEVAGFVGLNLLINNAGIARNRMLMDLSPYFMEEHFKTNAVGPVMLVKELLPMLQNAVMNKDWNNPGKFPGLNASKAAVLNISAWSGSLQRAMDPPIFEPEIAYRISKAALNMSMRCLSGLLKSHGILMVQMNPGYVKTSLGRRLVPPHEGLNPIEVSESVSSMLKTLAQCKESQHGGFIERNGAPIPY